MEPGLSVHMMVLHPPLDRMALLVDYLSVIADEYVVVDTGCTQDEADIMASWPKVRLVQEPFVDFSTTRNKGLAQHRYEWTLGIDPDELPSSLMMQHLAWVTSGESQPSHPDAKGWLYWTRNYWGGMKGPEFEYHWHCRLWRTEAGRLYRPVHELVSLDGRPEGDTRGTPVLPKAPRMAYLIHSKPAEEIVKADELYGRLGEISR